MGGPIRPDELDEQKDDLVPEEVFRVINELIAADWGGNSATVREQDIVTRVAGLTGEAIGDLLAKAEVAYRAAGWKVDYRKPGWGEEFGAYFVFKRTR